MTDKPALLKIVNHSDVMEAQLSAEWDIVDYRNALDKEAVLRDHAERIVGAITSGSWGVPNDLMDRLPNLKVISSYGVGYDTTDAVYAASKGIIVAHTPDVLNDEVADTAILLWLAVNRRLLAADAWVRTGDWGKNGPFPLTRSAAGQTVGILGLGRIGQTIADRAQAFGAKVVYHARTRKDVDLPYYVTLTDMAQAVDALIVITPGGAETRHLVDQAVLEALGPNGVLVNVARGSVVDETALVQALGNGTIKGAGLDVFDNEPNVASDLCALDNVVMMPHVGSATVETRAAMGQLTCDNLSHFLQTGSVLTAVPECAAVNKKS